MCHTAPIVLVAPLHVVNSDFYQILKDVRLFKPLAGGNLLLDRSLTALFITGLPYGNTAIPVGKWVEFLRFIFFRVGKSLACHSPGKWCLCA